MNSCSVGVSRMLHSTSSCAIRPFFFYEDDTARSKMHFVVRKGLESGDILLSTHDHVNFDR